MGLTSPRGLRGGTVSLGVVDQALSSLTNTGASIVAARTLEPEQFGAFSVAFVTYVLCLGAVRALVSEPLTVRASTSADREARDSCNAACGLAGIFAVVAALLTLASTLVLSEAHDGLAIALAVVLPGLLMQDVLRFVLFVRGKAAGAVINDGLWLLWTLCAIALFRGSMATPPSVLLAWGSGAGVAALVAAMQTRVVPAWGRAAEWLRRQRDLSPQFFGEFVAAQGSGQLTLYLVGVYAGLGELASLRGAYVLYGPFHVALSSARLMIPDLVRLRERSDATFRRSLLHQTMLLMTLAPTVGLVLIVLPDSIGTQLLGDTWSGARAALAPVGLQKLGVAAAVGAFCGLRVLAAARASLRIQAVTAVLTAVAGLLGARFAGAPGAAWGMACAQVVGATLYWHAFVRARGVARAARPRRTRHSGMTVLKTFVMTRPRLYRLASSVTPGRRRLLVRRTHDLVVEGFPRSANTFVQHALVHANPGLRVASHTHAAAQVMAAVEMGIPTVVLIREPREAVASLLQFAPTARPVDLYHHYIWFYGSLLRVADRVVVATMRDVAEDLGSVIRLVNHQFSTHLREYSHAADGELFATIDAHQRARGGGTASRSCRPDVRKRKTRMQIMATLEAPALRALEQRALAVAARVLEVKGRPVGDLWSPDRAGDGSSPRGAPDRTDALVNVDDRSVAVNRRHEERW